MKADLDERQQTNSVQPVAAGRWVGFWVAVAAAFLALAFSGAPSPLYVLYQHRFGFGSGATSFIYAIYALGVMVALLTMGGVSDRLGRRPVLLASVGLLALASLLFLVSDGLMLLLIARLLQGVATGILTGAVGGALSELHPHHDHRFAALANSASTSLGTALGALGSALLATYGVMPMQMPFIVLLVLTGIEMLAIATVLPETISAQQRRGLSDVFRFQRPQLPPGRHFQFWIGSCAVFCAWSIGGLYLALGGAILHDMAGARGLVLSGMCILLVQGVGGVSTVAWQIFASRTRVRRVLRFGVAALVLGVTISTIALRSSQIDVFYVGAVVTGIGFGFAYLGGTAEVNVSAPPERRGEVMALFFVVAYCGISIPALVAGFIAERIGLVDTFTGFAAILIVTSLALLAVAAKPVGDELVGQA